MEEAVAHVLGEESDPVLSLWEGVDDVEDEGGKGEPHFLHFPVILSLQVVPVQITPTQSHTDHLCDICPCKHSYNR